ncbi:5'-3' exonuclease [Metamycoplasma equirhinis]|uniref:5'-3' exonuclease n=1 Tax=Metamycoplasma equirhinis TaxID=92402 RepID=A0ABZ0PAH4_9BACT|nr:5'-3' exonuclease [Metamycoplasma equirhinis]WPB54017.1 5'-3' exonuclease [Metamycoplasma equirhinis]
MNEREILLVIDGTYLAYRSYYATAYKSEKILQANDGFETNAIVAFFNTLLLLLKDYKPNYIYVAFDSHIKTFRHEIFDGYKAGRQKAPREFYLQLDLIQKLLSALNIQNQYCDGYEADDIVAKAKINYTNVNVLIFSADQDLNQLIDKRTAIIKKINGEMKLITDFNFNEYYDFNPDQVIDYKALVGDNSDNFKGVPGIGPKYATNLLSEYYTLENIYENLELIKPTIAKKLSEYKQNAMRDKYIATLCTEFDLKMPTLNRLSVSQINLSDNAENILNEYQLFYLRHKIEQSIKKAR